VGTHSSQLHEKNHKKKKVRSERAGGSGDARLLPAFVVHKVMWPDGVQFCVRFVPNLAFEDFSFVDEGSVIAEHTLVDREGWC
jgi:hypothetical protein